MMTTKGVTMNHPTMDQKNETNRIWNRGCLTSHSFLMTKKDPLTSHSFPTKKSPGHPKIDTSRPTMMKTMTMTISEEGPIWEHPTNRQKKMLMMKICHSYHRRKGIYRHHVALPPGSIILWLWIRSSHSYHWSHFHSFDFNHRKV